MQTINLRTDKLSIGAHRAAGFGGAIRPGLARAWSTLRAWIRILDTRRDLDGLDDRMLADLGISRAQADFQLNAAPWRVAREATRR